MSFKNACFISYSGSNERRNEFVRTFKEGLEEQLMNIPKAGAFLDRERIKGGDSIPVTLAKELCMSACMVLIYNPSYFDLEHDYCAREYKAMRKHEKERIPQGSEKSLIITVVLKGKSFLPSELKNTLIIDFEDELLSPESFSKEDVQLKLLGIARAIEERYYGLQKQLAEIELACLQCEMPTSKSVKKWLKKMVDERDRGMDIFPQ